MAYSFSQIHTYLNCPLKYRYEKVDNLKPQMREESLHLILGTTVHETLEEVYKQVGNMKIPTYEQIQDFFSTLREQELKRVNDIHGIEYFEKETQEGFFLRGQKYIQRYYDTYYPFDQAISMKTEENINFEIAEGLKFRGKIDRLDIKGDTLTIVDYKTNRALPKDNSNSIEEQITLYGIGVAQDYGKQIQKILGKVIYLHMEKEYQREITREKIEQIKNKYLAIIQEIEQKKEKYDKGNGDQEIFEPTPGYVCQNCPFMQICPVYKHKYLEDEQVENSDLATTTIKKLVEEYAIMQEKYKNIESEKKLIAQILTEYANKKGCNRLYGDNYKLSVINTENYSINKDSYTELENKLRTNKLLEEVKTIDRFKLGNKFKKEEREYDEYKDFVEKKTSSSLRVGKNKDGNST